MAPKTRAPRGKKKNQVAVKKAMEKNKTCRRLLNSALAAPSHSLTPGSRRKKQVLRSVKAGLHFSICQIGRYLKEGRYYQRIGFGAPVYLVVVLEYLTAKVLGLARQAAKESKKICTIPRHAMLGVMRGEELSKLMAGVTITHSSVLPSIHESLFGDGTTEDTAKLPTKDVAKSPKNIAESS